jgi:hypothetical protein
MEALLLTTYVIHHDPGGVVMRYADRFEGKEQRIIIDGWCASACTLALGQPHTCVTPRAKLGFHAASGDFGTQYLLASYPEKVRQWIEVRGGLSTKMLILQGKELHSVVSSCNQMTAVGAPEQMNAASRHAYEQTPDTFSESRPERSGEKAGT